MGNQATCPSPGGEVYEIGGGDQRERWLSMGSEPARNMVLGRDSISAAAAVRVVFMRVEATSAERGEWPLSFMQRSS